jgi:disulfide bond formation protein DsbB
MTHDTIVALSVLAVIGQVLVGIMILVGLLALVGVRGPLDAVRRMLWGYELWAAFVVAAIATGGSLFYSQVAGFIPCELCWFQRVCMYPLSILTLLMAWRGDNRAARYLLPLQYGAITEPSGCFVGAPGGCGTNWIKPDSFGYLSIPTIALTGFLLLIGFLVLATTGEAEDAATLPAHAER